MFRSGAIVLFTLLVCALPTHAQDDLGAFTPLRAIPREVDAAAVFNNPADTLLLSPTARSIRAMLARGGVFTQTERAWQALGTAFDAPVDDTIRALLSKRVAVIWDGFERGDQTVQGLTKSIDTKWALVCEVEPAYLQMIRTTMRPVKRDIVHGRAVYAIEQGRYHLALLESPKPNAPAIVLLSPRSGTPLLHEVMGSIINQEEPAAQAAAITTGREPMLRELSEHQALQDDTAFSFAFMASTRIFRSMLSRAEAPNEEADHILAAIVQLDEDGMRCDFASDLPVDENLPDAPVALWDSTRHNTIFAIASARGPRMTFGAQSMHIACTPFSAADGTDSTQGLFDAPSYFMMHETPQGETAMSALLRNPKRAPAETARMADELFRCFINAYDPQQAPSFDARFPQAIRSVRIHRRNDDQPQTNPRWPGSEPSIGWLVTQTDDADLLIATMTPNQSDPAAPIRAIEDATRTLDAFGAERTTTGVLLRAMIKPQQTLRLIGDASLMDLALAKLVQEIELEIRRGIDAPMRGQLQMRFAAPDEGAILGVD